jgi:DME family drug/metabolite transporter
LVVHHAKDCDMTRLSDAQPPAAGEESSTLETKPRLDPVLVGTLFGVLASITYTVANMALRHVAKPGDIDWAIWVSAVKAVPAAMAAWVLIAYRASRGLPALPPRQFVLPLLLAGLVMQLGGNMMFQLALGLGGLALTVPLMFAALIITGAWMGRLVLGEGISYRSGMAMAVLIAAIVLLSTGAEDAAKSMTASASSWTVVGAVLAAFVAGCSFGANGVVIRRMLSHDLSLSATLVLLSSVGVVGLGAVGLWRLGPDRIAQTTTVEWQGILLAGVMNAAAFFSVSAAFKRIPVVRVNLVNASQAALAAVGGVLFFEERATFGVIAGTLLTVVGLTLMGRPERADAPSEKGEQS